MRTIGICGGYLQYPEAISFADRSNHQCYVAVWIETHATFLGIAIGTPKPMTSQHVLSDISSLTLGVRGETVWP